jgi:hypothetical protein
MYVDPSGTPASVTGAIRQAARMTGADFQYLLATAQVESNLNAGAQAPTSSARGLFQFIEQTWLATLKEEGPALGFGRYADAISRLPSGEYAVSQARNHAAVMNLRADPTASAVMAGAFTRSNTARLTEAIGRHPTEGELYLAHFLGPAGAIKLIGLAAATPETGAADAFPGAARSNPSIFYDRNRRARGAGEVYRLLVARYDTARAGGGNLATAPLRPTIPVAAQAAAVSDAAAPVDTGPVFHALFRTGARQEAVAPVVSALWGAPKPRPMPEAPPAAAPTLPAPAQAVPGPVPAGGPLDLFQDQLPDARALFRGRV